MAITTELFQIFGKNNDIKRLSGMLLMTVFILLVTIILWKRRWLYYYSYNIPGPFAIPLVGNGLNFLQTPSKTYETVLKYGEKYKPVCRLWAGPILLCVVSSPKTIEIVLNNCLEKGLFYKPMRDYLKNCLMAAPVRVWKSKRKMIISTFNQENLNRFVWKFEEKAAKTVKQLEEDMTQIKYIDAADYIQRYSIEIMMATIFNYKMDATAFMDMVQAGLPLLWYQITNILALFNLKFGCDKELLKILNESRKVAKQVLDDKRLSTANNYENHDDEINRRSKPFLDHLIDQGDKLSDEEIINEGLLMFIAGSDTSANTIGFALVMLGMHQDIQQRVYEEICEVMDKTQHFDYELIQKLTYLDMVIKETLRLFPVPAIISRYINKNLKLNGSCTLPDGSVAIISPLALHRDPEYWPDPLKFNPDRFLPEEVEKRHPYSFIPFSGGPRKCIGIQYSMTSMKLFVATMVRHFKITTCYKKVEDIKLKLEVDLKSEEGYLVKVESRK